MQQGNFATQHKLGLVKLADTGTGSAQVKEEECKPRNTVCSVIRNVLCGRRAKGMSERVMSKESGTFSSHRRNRPSKKRHKRRQVY